MPRRNPRAPLPLALLLPKRRGHKIRPLSPVKIQKIELTLADYLMGLSTFGGTSLEKVVDGAAKMLGFQFDYAQYYIPLPDGSYTVVDRVLMATRTLVFIDGPQHSMRMDREQTDILQKMQLEAMGWVVVRLPFDELLTDPIGTTRRVLWGF